MGVMFGLCAKSPLRKLPKKTLRAKNRGMTRVIFGSKDNTKDPVYCATVTDILGRDSGHFINNNTFVKIGCIGDTKDIRTKKSIKLMTLKFFFGLLCYLRVLTVHNLQILYF